MSSYLRESSRMMWVISSHQSFTHVAPYWRAFAIRMRLLALVSLLGKKTVSLCELH
jgi:hypothetical protein